ncbi:MAG: hypothetical protein AAF664_13305 [Planctomycetota bacterium]
MFRWLTFLQCIVVASLSAWMDPQPCSASDPIIDGEMAGYLLAPLERVPPEFDAGFSMYVSAWPLLEHYPGRRFQTGLFSTWMFPVYDPPVRQPLKDGVYTDVEGGLGWWRDTRFATETPKFIMGGVDLNFRKWANGPGAGKGRDWNKPQGKYGVAQLSSRVLWPPDGLNLKQGTSGELCGYGYLPLPLTPTKSTTDGNPVATGNQCWTLFLNTDNFKGPVAFFTPYFWSQVLTERPELEGKLLDAAPVNPNRSLQMETQYIPAKLATSAEGVQYARVAHVRYPVDESGQTKVVHQITSYQKNALWESVEAWFAGGQVAATQVPTSSSHVHHFTGKGGATWKIYDGKTAKAERYSVAWDEFAKPTSFEEETFGFQWQDPQPGPLQELPLYFRLRDDDRGRKRWHPINVADVPDSTGLTEAEFTRYERSQIDAYITPTEESSSWKKPGPAAGPFKAFPGDESELTYYWYRFADQPSMLNAGLSDEERETVQKRVEKIHRHWQIDDDYLQPPKFGKLAEIDPALIVTPPAGFEIGYVPIVTRQGRAE